MLFAAPLGKETVTPGGWNLMEISLDKKLRHRIGELLRSDIHAKLQKRLFCLLWLDEGMSIDDVAALLHITSRCIRDWLRIFRNEGFDALLVLHYKGDSGNLTPSQVEQLKAEIQTGRFHCARQIQDYLQKTFQIKYSLSGTKRLLQRIDCSYHQITGYLFKANRDKQEEFVKNYEANRANPGEKKRESILSTPAIPSGAWKPSSAAGSCVDNASRSA
jgi:transposase